MIPKSLRLGRREYTTTLQSGRRQHKDGITLVSRNTGSTESRFGIIVPKSALKLATRRNRMKRFIRSAILLCRGNIPPGMDFVIMVQRMPKEPTASSVYGVLSDLIAHAK